MSVPMYRLRFWLIFVVLIWGAVPAAAQHDAAIPDDVRAHLRARVEVGEHPGIVVGVVDPGGTTVFSHGRTAADDDVQPDAHTLFEIGSVTKVFTALLLAEMAERGEVAIDDPVARYLPDPLRVPGGDTITLEHLAMHTSGLPRMPSNFRPAEVANPYVDYTVGQMYHFLSSYTLPREPGAQYEYSNFGMGLLGHALVRAAETDYERALHRLVLDPLDLDDTAVALSADQLDQMASGHREGQVVPNWDIPTLGGAGALRSTADDMLRFLSAQLGLVETPLYEAMLRTRESRADAGEAGTVALGWHVRDVDGRDIYWHNGGTGGFSSFVGFDPERRRGAVVLVNSDLGADDVGFHLLAPTIPLKELRETVELPAETLESYVGTYELAPTFIIEVTREGGQLYVQATGQPRFAVYPSSERDFFLKAVDAQVTFNVDEAGDVESLTLHQGGLDQLAKRIQ